MASQRYNVSRSPSSASSPYQSYRSLSDTDSPIFCSPRSSPDAEVMENYGTFATATDNEEEQLVTQENHFARADSTTSLVPASLAIGLPAATSSNSPASVSFWGHLRSSGRKVKPWVLFFLAVAFIVLLSISEVEPGKRRLLCVSVDTPQYLALKNETYSYVTVEVQGPFASEDKENFALSTQNLSISLVSMATKASGVLAQKNISIMCTSTQGEKNDPVVSRTVRLHCEEDDNITHVVLTATTSYPIAISVMYFEERNVEVVFASVILVGVYILIIFEFVHRATAAMLGALASLATLSIMDKRPSLDTIISWIEWKTLVLLFGMMILVAIFAKSGFFDYVALKAYKLSRGHVWGLITLLCACTAFISAVLDNVTVILLLTPVTVTLCQVLNLNPTYILIAEVIFSNIGGTATAIGDPPNVILVSNKDLISHGIHFVDFLKHLAGGILVCVLVAYVVLRLLYRKVKIVSDDPPIIEEIKREAEIWKRTADRLPQISAEEKTVKLLLMQRVMLLQNNVRNMKRNSSRQGAFQRSLSALEKKYVIRDKALLFKSLLVIILVVGAFFAEPAFKKSFHLDVGWIAVLGAILLILLADVAHFEEIMEKVEWTTLVFFSGLFILMESLNELGLMDFLGDITSSSIERLAPSDDPKTKRGIAIIIILWVSALVSAFIDNIPFTTAMIPVILKLNANGIKLEPLVWALAMGSCLGGNGTLIGASANVVCSGLSEQYGYPISFSTFFKIGFLIMLATTTTAMVYLLIIEVLISNE
ncbi:P protein-like isoform X1 [Stylophora pistillata]|uniref:P protein-like isoform X1 n=1 Tax=Stylophora pistillata TaxID=50429 RepID=UPI000C0537CB|nr:P protein-like isoform X1 [Stylophora pistillata]